MTEHEWDESVTPNLLLAHLRPWAKHRRKLRLYVCAWWRREWKLLNEPCRDLIERCEEAACTMASSLELVAAKRVVTKRAQKEWVETGQDGLAELGPTLLKQLRLQHLPGWEGMPRPPTWYSGGAEQQRQANEDARAALMLMQVVLLRDIFGNPFRPVRVDPGFLTDTLRCLARAAYEDRRLPEGSVSPHRCTALADALETTGYSDFNVLSHLRSQGPHVLGCWAVEMFVKGCRS